MKGLQEKCAHTCIVSIDINWKLPADIRAPLRPDEPPSVGVNQAAGQTLFCLEKSPRNSPSCVNIYTKLHVKDGVFEGQVCFAGLCVVIGGGVTAVHHAAAYKDTAPGQRPDFVRRAIARHRARQRGEQAPGHCVVSAAAMAASLVRKLGSGSGNQGPARWLEKMNEKRL